MDSQTATPYTKLNLTEAEDLAARHGYGELQEARFPYRELGAEQTGFAYIRVRPNVRQPFAHRHRRAEEIYVVLAGAGQAILDGEAVEVGPLDAIRVAPPVVRSFEAGPEGLELLVFGPRHPDDAEIVRDE